MQSILSKFEKAIISLSPSIVDEEFLLLQKIAVGDTEAFARIFHYYQPIIYTFSLPILKSETLAEEVVQEVMLKLWRMGERVSEIKTLDTFLKVAARNKAIDVLRRQHVRTKKNAEQAGQWVESANFTEEKVLLQEALSLLAKAVERLPEKQRLVYHLSVNEGIKISQIADQLKLKPDTVKTHLKLARKNLRTYMSRYTDMTVILILFKFF